MNLPNKITVARLLIAIVIFFLLALPFARHSSQNYLLWDVTFVLFLIAAFSDILDGYLARKYNLSTTFGRIADPFVDKIVICGIFIFFIDLTEFIYPWMVVIIIGREFLVSGLRGYAESQGIAFPAKWWGKAKTVTQSITLGAIFVYSAHLQGVTAIKLLVEILVWSTLGLTIASGYSYIHSARGLFQGENNI